MSAAPEATPAAAAAAPVPSAPGAPTAAGGPSSPSRSVTPVRPPGPPFRLSGLLRAFDRSRPPRMFLELARTYPSVAWLRAPGLSAYVLSEPELVRELLVTGGRFVDKGPGLHRAKIILGEGLLTAERERHRRNRRLVQPTFAPARMAGYAQAMVSCAEALSQRWQAGRPVLMESEMAALTLDIVGRALFGTTRFGREEADEVADALGTVLSGWEKLLLPGVERLVGTPLPWARRLDAARERLGRSVRAVLAEASAARATGSVRSDLLAALLEARDAESATDADAARMDDAQVRDEIMTLLLAGHETTANTLTWALGRLARHPEVGARLRAEVAGPVTFDRLRDLPYTTAVVAETLRLHPPAWVLERQTTAPMSFAGWDLPLGSVVLASPYALHRDARYWADPEQFRPERWLTADGAFDESAPGQPRGAWLPFGAGNRVCIGESFAWAEAVLVLAVLCQAWAPVLAPEASWRLRAAVTLRPADGMPMVLQRAH